MTLKLKVKICTLAAESQIIRRQQRYLEKKAKGYPTYQSYSWNTPSGVSEEFKVQAREMRLEKKKYKARLALIKMGTKPANIWPELQMHRRGIVRREARASLLAYAFLRNVPYLQVEAKYHDGNAPDWTRVEQLITRFTIEKDLRIVLQRFAEWKDADGQKVKNNGEVGSKATQAA